MVSHVSEGGTVQSLLSEVPAPDATSPLATLQQVFTRAQGSARAAARLLSSELHEPGVGPTNTIGLVKGSLLPLPPLAGTVSKVQETNAPLNLTRPK